MQNNVKRSLPLHLEQMKFEGGNIMIFSMWLRNMDMIVN